MRLLDHMVVLFLIFWGTSILFSIVPHNFTHLPTMQSFQFLHNCINTFVIGILNLFLNFEFLLSSLLLKVLSYSLSIFSPPASWSYFFSSLWGSFMIFTWLLPFSFLFPSSSFSSFVVIFASHVKEVYQVVDDLWISVHT